MQDWTIAQKAEQVQLFLAHAYKVTNQVTEVTCEAFFKP